MDSDDDDDDEDDDDDDISDNDDGGGHQSPAHRFPGAAPDSDETGEADPPLLVHSPPAIVRFLPASQLRTEGAGLLLLRRAVVFALGHVDAAPAENLESKEGQFFGASAVAATTLRAHYRGVLQRLVEAISY